MEELEGIVQRMIDAGEPEENIKLVIEEYENVNGLEKLNAVEDGATATAGTEEAGTDLALEDGSLESPEEAKDLGFFDSIYNSLSNFVEQLWDIPEFYGLYSGDEKGANASLEIAAKSMSDAIFNSESVQKFAEETGYDFLTQGLSEEDLFENIRQRKIEQDKTLPTKEVIKSIKEGDIPGLGAGIFNAVTNGLGSALYGITTFGAGFFADYAADNYINYNKLKAENLGISMDELIKSGEADNAIPLTMASVSAGLEKLGLGSLSRMAGGILKGTAGKGSASLFAQMNRNLAEKVFYNKNARTAMAVVGSGLTEFSTEILQHASDKVNEEFGSVAGTDKSADVLGAALDAVTSEEGLEAGIQGFFGATGIGGAAISAKAMSSIRNIVDGESTTENIDKLVKLNNQKQAATDNTVKKGLQKLIDKLEQEISDSVDRGNEIYDSLSDGKIQEIEDLTELAEAANYNITELNKKFRRGDISQEEYNTALTGFNEEYNSARQTLVDMRLSENIEFAKKEGEKLGLDVQVKETEEEYLKALRPLAKKMNLQKWSKMSKEEKGKYKSFKDFENAQLRSEASFVGQGKIFINKEGARKGGAINVGAHEILHPILNKIVGDASKQLGIVRAFKKSMTWDQKKKVEAELTKRGYLTKKERATEYLTVFSDLLSKKKINYDRSALEKLSDAIIGTLKKAGVNNVSLESGKDAYEFMAEYQESIEKGEFTEEMKGALGKDLDLSKVDAIDTQQKSAEVDKIEAEIDKLDDQLNDGSIDGDIYEERTEELFKQLADAQSRPEKEIKDKAKPKQKQRVTEAQKGLNKKVDDLVGEKNEDGDYVMTKDEWDDGGLVDAYEAIISGTLIDALIKRGVVGEPSYLRQFTNDVKDGLTETLMRFNPEKNNSLIGFINGQLRFRKGDVLKSYKANLTASLDVESGEIGAITGIAAEEEFDVEAAELSEAKENAKKIKASERFIQSPKLRAKLKRRIAEDIKNVPTEERTFKKAPFLAADIMAEEIGVPAKKIVDKKANLSSAELSKGAMYILKVADSIATLLPKGHVDGAVSSELQGTGSNIPGNVLRAYYDKDTSRLRTGPGLSPYIKKKNLSGKDILAGIGVEDGKLRNNAYPRGAEGQTVKGLLNVITRLVENEYSRRFGDLTEQQVADYKGGLQDIQFSKNTEDIVKDIYADYDLFNSLSEVQFSRKTEYQNYLKKNRLDLQLLPEPEKNKAAKELVDSIFTWANSDAVPQALKGPYKDLALFYVGKSSIKLPENAIDIVEVYRLSKLYNVNPKHFSDNPQEFITEYSKKATGKTKKVNPDKVKEFYDKVTFDEIGVTLYSVEDSKAGQRAVRAAVDDEWGETANPWCLIARRGEINWDDAVTVYSEAEALKAKKDFESEGREAKIIRPDDDSNAGVLTLEVVPTNKITKEDDLNVAYKFWDQYNGKDGYGFVIAFQNNKLISLRDGTYMTWWDRFDEDTVDLPISLGIDKKTGWNKLGKLNSSPKVREITAEMNELANKLNYNGEVDYAEKSTELRKQQLLAKRNQHKEGSWEVTGYQTGSVKKDATHKVYDAQKRLVSEVVRQDGKIIKEVNVKRIGSALIDKLLTTTTTELSSYYKDGRLRKSKITIENKRPPSTPSATYLGKYPAIDKVNVTTSEYKYIPIARPYQRVNDDKLVTTEIQSFENSKPKGSMKTVTIVQEPLGFGEPVKQTYYRSVEGSDAKYAKPFDRLQELNEYINESSVLEPSSAMMFSLGLTATGDQDSLLEIQFSKKKRKEYEDVLRKKRPGLIDIPKQVDELFKWADGLVENGIVPENKISKYKKLALHYTANGYTKFPEDGYKIQEVIRLTERNLFDKDKKKIIINPYAFSNPDELIVKYTEFEKAKKVNPDEVKEFTDKQKLSNGVVVYEVEDSKAGQKAVRGIVDSEWGINANPWCLVARAKTRMAKKGFKTEDDAYEYIREATSKGLTVSKPRLAAAASDWGFDVGVVEPFEFDSETELDSAWKMWKTYNKQEEGFKIAFQNGKLISFRDGNEQNWWDRFDQETELLKISLGIDKDKNSKTAGLKILGGMDDLDGSFKITGYERNSKQIQNGTYEYYDSDKKLTETIAYKDSVITKETKMVVDSKGTTTEVFSYDKNGRPLTETYVDISKTVDYKDTPKRTLKEQQETARSGVFPPVGEKIYNIKKYSNKTTHEYIDNRSFGDRDAEVRTTISKETYNGKLQSTTKEIWLKTFIGSGETALPNRWKKVYIEKYVPLDSKANFEIKYRVDITDFIDPKKGETVVVVDKRKELEEFKKFNKQFSKSVDQAAKRNNKMLPKPLRLIGSFTNQDVLDRMAALDMRIDAIMDVMVGYDASEESRYYVMKKKDAIDEAENKRIYKLLNKRDKPQTKRLAPNGKRSNLNDQQYDMVRTPKFKKWFGDWENNPDDASKVLDENGEPRVVWRGRSKKAGDTGSVINIRLTREGPYFTDKKSNAVIWMERFYELKKGEYEVIEVFLNIRNPDMFKDFWHDFLDRGRTGPKTKWMPPSGKDGAIILDDVWIDVLGNSNMYLEGKQFIATKSNQIKSADGSNKTFDVNENRIQFSRDGFKIPLGTYPADGGTEAILKRMSYSDPTLPRSVWTTPSGDRAAPRTKRLAPNGRRSNLNDEQYDLVRTPEFKRWFGDWEYDPNNASKVLDENGEPRVAWRSEMLDNNPSLTSKGVFDIKNKTYSGAYFSDNRQSAEMWAVLFQYSEGNKRPYSLTEAFLNIRNPEVFENHSSMVMARDNIEDDYRVGTGRTKVWVPRSSDEDGVIVEKDSFPWFHMPSGEEGYDIDVGTGKQYIVINSGQIKLADGSNTTFDVNEDRIQFSKKKDKPKSDLNIKLDSDFNKILEAKTGVAAGKEFAPVRGEIAGKGKGFFKSIIKPSAEDFVGLLYATLGKGKEGNEQMAWYKANLLDPYARGIRSITTARSVLMQEFKELKKEFKGKVSPKRLREKIPGSDFTVEQAIRVHIWRKANYRARKDEKKTKDIQIPDVSESDIREMQTFMKNNPELMSFANLIMTLTKGDGYPKPSKLWHLGSIVTDLLEGLNTTTRAKYLAEWQENVDAIFSVKNLSKLEAVFGANYRNAMVDILYRMKTGRNRKRGTNKLENSVMDWINGSVGVIMFFNTKSALLQLLSMFNFINWSDNNILASGKAFANQKQFWKDFMVLWKSEFLLERRNNLKITVNEEELAEAAEKEGFKGAVNLLLQKGFTFTQFGDSFAIASGGAAFYRNRLNSYLKQGMPEVDAEKQAFNDFRELSEESQQSSRADKISQQQSGIFGRLVLAFANTPAQYARLIKKAVLDIKNGRGDLRENVSKILYYGVLQNLIFNALQTAILFFVFDDDDEEKEKKKNLKIIDVANGMLDSLLRGVGVYGAAISVAKNALLKVLKESDKPLPEYTKAVDELYKISPPIASKILRLNQAANSMRYDADEISSKGFSPSNPAYLAGANVISAAFNVPLDRLIRKIDNVGDAISSETTAAERTMLILGWSKWQLGIQEEQETIERGRRTTGSKKRSSRLKALEKRRK